jgi:flagella basal body P-ring formation protein FlgA
VVVNGQKAKRITVPTQIEVWSDVLLTTKPLGKYQPICRDDIQVKKMNLARVPANVIVRMDQVLGHRPNRNIAANCILRKDQIEMPPVVKRGDIVQVIAQTPMLKISIKGMAKQNGGKGERIKVVNLRSKKAIYAQVIDGQTVKVEF